MNLDRAVFLFFFSFLSFSGVVAGAVPAISDAGVVNAADYTANFAPGMIISLFGSGFASGTLAASSIPLPNSLGGVSVEVVDGSRVLNAPLFFVAPGQINCQLPFDIAAASVQVRVRTAQGVSGAQAINIERRCPRVFTQTQDGLGAAILLHSDYTLVNDSAPGLPGEGLILYLTGLGAVSPEVEAGQAGGDGSQGKPLNLVQDSVGVIVNGRAATVFFQGLAPNFAGLYQVNFMVPEQAMAGAAQLAVQVPNEASQPGVTFAVGMRWEAEGSGVLGPEGGAVTGRALTLHIPANTLPAGTQVSISRAVSGVEALPYTDSDVYRVSGLPLNFSTPITAELKLESWVEGYTHTMMLSDESMGGGEEFLDSQFQNGTVTATLTPAVVSGGQVAAEARDRRMTGDQFALLLRAIAGIKKTTGTHFTMFTNELTGLGSQEESAVMAGLEKAYGSLQNMGFDWGRRVDSSRPIPVSFYIFLETDNPAPEVIGEARRSLRTGAISLRLNGIGGGLPDYSRAADAAHVLMHLAQMLYEPADPNQQKQLHYRWGWADEATATWFQRFIGSALAPGGTTYIPRQFTELPASGPTPFDFVRDGLEYASSDSNRVRQNGYGAGMFIEHLVQAQNPNAGEEPGWIGEWYVNGKGKGIAPVTALQSAYGDLSSNWVTFCQRYGSGALFAFAPDRRFVNAPVAVANKDLVALDTPTSSKNPSWTRRSLAARLMRINLPKNYTWPPASRLLIVPTAATGDVVVDVRTIHGDSEGEQVKAIGLGTGQAAVKLDETSPFYDGLLAILANPGVAPDPRAELLDQISISFMFDVQWLTTLNTVLLNAHLPITCTQGFKGNFGISNWEPGSTPSIKWNTSALTFFTQVDKGAASSSPYNVSIEGTLSAIQLKQIDDADFEEQSNDYVPGQKGFHHKVHLKYIPQMSINPSNPLANYWVRVEDVTARHPLTYYVTEFVWEDFESLATSDCKIDESKTPDYSPVIQVNFGQR